MNPALLTAVGSIVTGVGGLFVAGFTIRQSFKNRVATHREFIYQKQAEALVSICTALNRYYQQCQSFIFINGMNGMTDEVRITFRQATSRGEISEAYWAFQDERTRSSIFLPRTFLERISNFEKVLAAISAFDSVRPQYPKDWVENDDPGGLLGDAYTEVMNAARHILGTDRLTDHNLSLIGSRPLKSLGKQTKWEAHNDCFRHDN